MNSLLDKIKDQNKTLITIQTSTKKSEEVLGKILTLQEKEAKKKEKDRKDLASRLKREKQVKKRLSADRSPPNKLRDKIGSGKKEKKKGLLESLFGGLGGLGGLLGGLGLVKALGLGAIGAAIAGYIGSPEFKKFVDENIFQPLGDFVRDVVLPTIERLTVAFTDKIVRWSDSVLDDATRSLPAYLRNRNRLEAPVEGMEMTRNDTERLVEFAKAIKGSKEYEGMSEKEKAFTDAFAENAKKMDKRMEMIYDMSSQIDRRKITLDAQKKKLEELKSQKEQNFAVRQSIKSFESEIKKSEKYIKEREINIKQSRVILKKLQELNFKVDNKEFKDKNFIIDQINNDRKLLNEAFGRNTPLIKKQKGGPIRVPGTGSGDTVPALLPPGSFVLNRNATNAFFQDGGRVPAMLEPQEMVFPKASPVLEMMNNAVPRFQTGGEVAKEIGKSYGIPDFNKSNVGKNLRYLSTGDAIKLSQDPESVSIQQLQKGGLVLFQGHGDVPSGSGIAPGTDAPNTSLYGKYKPTAEQYFMNKIAEMASSMSDLIKYERPTGKYYDGFEAGANWQKMKSMRMDGQSAIEIHADGYDGKPGGFRGKPGVLPGTKTGPIDAVGKAEENIRSMFGMYGGTRAANILELDNIIKVSQNPRKYANMLVKAAEGSGSSSSSSKEDKTGEGRDGPKTQSGAATQSYLEKLNDKNIKKATSRAGRCVEGSLNTMQKSGVPNPEATGIDKGNNPRGGAVQLIKNFGWGSIRGLGSPVTLKSPYGTVGANQMTSKQYSEAVSSGKIPSGAIIFQTEHNNWNGTSPGSRGYDMAIAQKGGNAHWNGQAMPKFVYGGGTKKIIALTPGGKGSGDGVTRGTKITPIEPPITITDYDMNGKINELDVNFWTDNILKSKPKTGQTVKFGETDKHKIYEGMGWTDFDPKTKKTGPTSQRPSAPDSSSQTPASPKLDILGSFMKGLRKGLGKYSGLADFFFGNAGKSDSDKKDNGGGSSSDDGDSQTSTSSPLTGDVHSKAKEMYDYIKDKGYTSAQAKGIVANIHRESTFDPKVRSGDDGGPGGLFQWKGSRQTPEVASLVNSGNWKGQIDYALREDVGPQYKDATANMSAHEASMWWAKHWERPASLSNADTKHKKFLSQYKFQKGGLVGAKLEPGESVFLPHMMNEAVPRFQAGGSIKSISGTTGEVTSAFREAGKKRLAQKEVNNIIVINNGGARQRPMVMPQIGEPGASTTVPSLPSGPSDGVNSVIRQIRMHAIG